MLTASSIALIAIGFALVYRTVRFFHFAHGIVFTAGAYVTFFFRAYFSLPFFLVIPIATALAAGLGCSMDVGIYRHLRRKQSSPLTLLLASLGIYIVLQNVISMVFGDDTKTIRSGVVKEGYAFFGARITSIQVLIICVSTGLVVAVWSLLKYTKLGRAMRAVANNPELAKASGIDSDRVIVWAFAIGSALAGIAGVLISLDVDMTPAMGMNALMMAVVAVIVGGVGSIPGIALGALLLGLAQHFGVWKLPSQWQNAIAFFVLLAFLLLRPQGFLGRKVRKATV
jgi:branched-chain amino acid transport system permease protein